MIVARSRPPQLVAFEYHSANTTLPSEALSADAKRKNGNSG